MPVPRARDRGAGDRRGPVHDPGRERAAGEPRPAPRRGRVSDPLQLPARPPDRRTAREGLRHRRARPAQGRRRARDQAAVPHPVEGAARVAAVRAAARRTRRARPVASTCSRASSPTRATASTRSPTATTGRSISRSCRCRSRCACAKTCRSISCGCRSAGPRSPTTTCAFHRKQPLLFDHGKPVSNTKLAFGGGLFLGLDLRGDADGRVGYRARDNAPLLDVQRSVDAPVDPESFWEVVARGGRPRRAHAATLLSLDEQRGGVHPADARVGDDGVRPDERRVAHALRGLLRSRLRLRPRRCIHGLARRSRCARTTCRS